MEYCKRCLYPLNTADGITLDDSGLCSGCKVSAEKEKINWAERFEILKGILQKYKNRPGAAYDCIIPVSGGKDSHFQTYVITKVFGLRPLLVTFNHEFNTKVGIRNMANMVSQFGCDHIRFTPNPKVIKKLSITSLKKMGDMCWHCHAGIFTYPVQIAVKFNIPLIVWGEVGYLDLHGMFSLNDLVEMTRKVRTEHAMRSYEPQDMITGENGLTMEDLDCFVYPSDEDIERVGVRGIFLGNYLYWNAKKQTELMIKDYGFETAVQERSYNTYENAECHCEDCHDYLKYLKFGYGRATDHTSQDIRLQRMTREQGIEMVKKYDSLRPKRLDMFLEWSGMTEEEFEKCVDSMRDKKIWEKDSNGKWIAKDSVANHAHDPGV